MMQKVTELQMIFTKRNLEKRSFKESEVVQRDSKIKEKETNLEETVVVTFGDYLHFCRAQC